MYELNIMKCFNIQHYVLFTMAMIWLMLYNNVEKMLYMLSTISYAICKNMTLVTMATIHVKQVLNHPPQSIGNQGE